MSKKPERKSNEAHDPAEDSSVFDFLYHDEPRVASFLAQLAEAGHLTQIKQTLSTAEGASHKTGAQTTAGIPSLAQFRPSYEDGASEERRDLQEKTFDPRWANALAILTLLEQRGLLHFDL